MRVLPACTAKWRCAHPHAWVFVAVQFHVCKTLPASPQQTMEPPSPAQMSVSLILRAPQQRGSHFHVTGEAREFESPDSSCNFTLPLSQFPNASLGDPSIIPQRCTKDEMCPASAHTAGKSDASRGWTGSRAVSRRTHPVGSGIAERAASHSMHLVGSECMCLCACVFLLRVCSLRRLYTDMHLLPCLEQRQLPLPFISSQHKPGMKYLSQCKST